MSHKIALLRGINVGGKRKILMKDLKALCEDLGWRNVKTYIQSGNVIFTSDSDTNTLEKLLHEAIKEQFEYDVPVIIRTKEALDTLSQINPFIQKITDITQLHITLLKEIPNKEDKENLENISQSIDQFKIVEKDIFIYVNNGKYHTSKLSNNFFEKKLKVHTTTRNWKTLLKLIELSK